MTDLNALRAALEQVKNATGPDRRIDQQVIALFFGRSFKGDIPHLSASIDAVKALIEYEAPELEWTLYLDGRADIYCQDDPLNILGSGDVPERPVLALLAAFLKALIAQEEVADA